MGFPTCRRNDYDWSMQCEPYGWCSLVLVQHVVLNISCSVRRRESERAREQESKRVRERESKRAKRKSERAKRASESARERDGPNRTPYNGDIIIIMDYCSVPFWEM